MNFLIFRYFYKIFLNLFKLIFYLKKIQKMVFISQADVAERHHVATCVSVCVCAHLCMCVRAQACE